MDEKDWLQYGATDAQLKQFNEDGSLIVEQALSPAFLRRLRVEARERQTQGLKPDDMLIKFRF